MKLLFTPAGLIVVLILVAIIFLPRRLPDAAKKLRKSMRAFPDEPEGHDDAPEDHQGGSDRT
ncbi:MAG TPA: twin-arginine translocase TatA/TatE family subunit [Coriobacteriia bacterium]